MRRRAAVEEDRVQLSQRPQRGNRRVPAGLALSKDGKTLYVAAAFGHSVARFDAESGAFRDEIALDAGSYPYGLALDETHNRLYVSLWSKAQGGCRGYARPSRPRGQWPTEEHPNEMLLAHEGKILFVANANRNTVTVIDTEAGKAIETIGTAIDPKAPPGSTPNSLALSPDESLLFVSNANTNNLAVVNVKDPGGSAPLGFIPTGWYPTSVRLSRDGKSIFVANGKGASSRANRDGPRPGFASGRNPIAGVHRRALPGDALAHRHAGAAADGCVFADGLRMQPAQARRPDRRDGRSAPHRATRFPRRWASRRRFATWSTSSRKTEPMIRSSAT